MTGRGHRRLVKNLLGGRHGPPALERNRTIFITNEIEWIPPLLAAFIAVALLVGLLRAMHEADRRAVLRAACGWGVLGLAGLLIALPRDLAPSGWIGYFDDGVYFVVAWIMWVFVIDKSRDDTRIENLSREGGRS